MGIGLGHLDFLVCASLVMYGQHYLDLGFRAEIIAGHPEIQPLEADKILSVDWYALNNLPEPLFEPIKIYLDAAATGRRYYHLER